MGLDMYAYKRKGHNEQQVDFDYDEFDKEIMYWRKHHDLHGWMENLYKKKGGTAESFNCVNLQLTKEDLEQLKQDILERHLPETTGFFFGNYPPDDESDVQDLKFIKEALKEIEKGNSIYYSSWW